MRPADPPRSALPRSAPPRSAPPRSVTPRSATPPFRLSGRAAGDSPLLLASPHSGRWLPEEFLAGCAVAAAALRCLEDAHVGLLLRRSAEAGVPLIEATHARAILDLNRAEQEYDPAMLDGRLPHPPLPSERVRRGYGLFPKFAAPGIAIHRARIPATTAAARIEALHRPWHSAIGAALDAARRRHGFAVLLDVHSMPPLAAGNGTAARLVLGDRFGRSAAPALVDWLEEAFAAEGLKVARNRPYAGGHDVERHGAPGAGLHAVQLEFDRSLYMDPGSLEPHEGFDLLAAMLARVVGRLSAWLARKPLAGGLPLAAE